MPEGREAKQEARSEMRSDLDPREEFVRALEARIAASLHEHRTTPAWWRPQRPAGLILAAASLALVSMAIGGGVVAAAYEAQENSQRASLVEMHERDVALAQAQLDLETRRLKAAQDRVSVGLETTESVQEARTRMTEGEARLRLAELRLAEVRVTGRDPQDLASAPRVGGRDLVTERWRAEMSIPVAWLEQARHLAEAEAVRFNVGMSQARDAEAARARAIELEATVDTWRRKLEVRQTFLAGGVPGPVADLRVLEVEADQRRILLTRRIEHAKRLADDMRLRVQIGTLAALDLAGAEVQLRELELSLSRATYDLALIRQQIARIRPPD